MNMAQKLILSLLLAIAVSVAFILWGSVGLFGWVEINIYSKSVQNSIEKNLKQFTSQITLYNSMLLNRIKNSARQGFMMRVFVLNQTREDILARSQYFDDLRSEIAELGVIRCVDLHGRLFYSTWSKDKKAEERNKVVYKRLDEEDSTLLLQGTNSTNPQTRIIIDGQNNQFIYQAPIFDGSGSLKGFLAFYVYETGLLKYLVQNAVLNKDQTISLIRDAGIIINPYLKLDRAFKLRIAKQWNGIEAGFGHMMIMTDDHKQRYFLTSVYTDGFGYVGILSAENEFILNPQLRIILQSALAVTFFLLIFFIFNLRQDKIVIAAENINRFRIQFLKEYINSKKAIDTEKWKAEIEHKREYLRTVLLAGIGRINEKEKEAINILIDRSWEEIVDIFSQKMGERSGALIGAEVIEKALENVFRKKNILLAEKREGEQGQQRLGAPVQTNDKEERVFTDTFQAEEPEEVAELEEAEELEEPEEPEEPEEVAVDAVAGAAEEPEEAPKAEKTPWEEAEETEPLEEAEALEPEGEESSEEVFNLEKLARNSVFSGGLFVKAMRFFMGGSDDLEEIKPADGDESQEMEDGSEMAELEELEDIAPLGVSPQGKAIAGDVFAEKIANLTKHKRLEVYTVEEVQDIINDFENVIKFGDGIYTINESIINAETEPKDKKLKGLVEEVLKSEKHGIDEVGIENLISVSDVELPGLTEISDKETKESKKSVQRSFEYDSRGLLYDSYYQGSIGDIVTTAKTLMRISKQINAIFSVLLVRHQDEYKSEYAVGFDRVSRQSLKIDFTEPMFQQFFLERKIVYIRAPLSNLNLMEQGYSPSDRGFIQGNLYLPVVLADKECYIYFGLKGSNLDIKEILYRLYRLIVD